MKHIVDRNGFLSLQVLLLTYKMNRYTPSQFSMGVFILDWLLQASYIQLVR